MTQPVGISKENSYKKQALQEKMSVSQTAITPQMRQAMNAQDTVSMGKKAKKPEKTGPVNFGEGAKLVAKGFFNKAKGIVTSIVKHPLKTIAAIGITTAALGALPLIGISTAVGASALAIGFAGIAVFKGAKDISKAIKHNKTQDYQALRTDLQKIGGDTLDLALSIPFVPKAIKTVKNYAKFGPKVGFNAELWSNLKQTKGVGKKAIEFVKADLKIKYHQMAGEMGLKVKPKLEFADDMPMNMGGAFDPAKGTIEINTQHLNPIKRFQLKQTIKKQGAKLPVDNLNPESFLRHELEHAKQFAEMARVENIGVNGIKNTMKKYYEEVVPQCDLAIDQMEWSLDTIKIDTSIPEKVKKAQIAELENQISYFKKLMKQGEEILKNPSAMDTSYYDDMIAKAGKISANDKQAAVIKEYMDGFLGKLDDQQKMEMLRLDVITGKMDAATFNAEALKIYEANALEAPAYAVQRQYIKEVLKNRANLVTAALQADSAIAADAT